MSKTGIGYMCANQNVTQSDNFVNKSSLRDIPAVPGLVLTLRENIRSSASEMGGTVTTTQTLNCPTFSFSTYDTRSNPTTTPERGLGVTYNTARWALHYNCAHIYLCFHTIIIA